MTDVRDRISRKIAALFARAEDAASTPEEIALAMRVADKLMAEYDLTRDEAALRSEAMGRRGHVFPLAERDYAGMLAAQIRRLVGCRVNGSAYRLDDVGMIDFLGLRVDVEYASWLFRTSLRALHMGWRAYAASPGHDRLIADGAASDAVERQFKLGFCMDLCGRIKALIAERSERGTALVPVKDRLIEEAFGDAAVEDTGVNRVAIRAELDQAFRSGVGEGAKVGLHRTLG